jgi:mRNA interferase MazF
MTPIEPRRLRFFGTWRRCVRGEVYRQRPPRGARGHEQSGVRYAVVVQSELLPLSTWLVAPTSTAARPATFRPEVSIDGRSTRVLVEQTSAVDPQRLGESAGHLSFDEIRQVDAALRLVLVL